jgi:hypothetical protein
MKTSHILGVDMTFLPLQGIRQAKKRGKEEFFMFHATCCVYHNASSLDD